MFGAFGVTGNTGLIRLMRSADEGPHGKPRNRSVHTERLIPCLWEPDPCCLAATENREMDDVKCEGCGEKYYYLDGSECPGCGCCVHCGIEREENPPKARHVCTFKMMHNTYEERTCWQVRVKANTPGATKLEDDLWMLQIWLDVEHGLVEEVSWPTRLEEIRHGADMTPEETAAMLDGTLKEKLRQGAL